MPSRPRLPIGHICFTLFHAGYTLFVEDEDKSANAILTRSDMESYMVRL